MSYCKFIQNLEDGERKKLHKDYHDNLYGFPIYDDDELFGRLIMEINQAGLSWEIVLKKEKDIRKAYNNFNIKKISKYTEKDIEKIMSNAGVIRNRRKIEAIIENAKNILIIQKEYGSFEKWLDVHKKNKKEDWIRLFKKTFKFTGGEITNEFLMSIGYLDGAHDKDCIFYKKII